MVLVVLIVDRIEGELVYNLSKEMVREPEVDNDFGEIEN